MSNLIQMLKPKTNAQTTTLFAWALIAPAALVMFWIVVWPLYETFRLSFTNSNLGTLMGVQNLLAGRTMKKRSEEESFLLLSRGLFIGCFYLLG